MPEKMTLHYKDGSTTAMDAIDARHVLRAHASEWATSPFPADVQKAAQEDAEALRLHLAKLRSDGKTEIEIEKARHAWAEGKKPDASSAKPDATVEPVAPFATKEKKGGWYGIFDANGLQIGKNLREDDAKAFDAMSDEDKAEYVKAELADS